MNHQYLKTTPASNAESGYKYLGISQYSYAYTLPASSASPSVPTPSKQGCEKQNADAKLGSVIADQACLQCAVFTKSVADQNETLKPQLIANRKLRRTLQSSGIDISGDGYLRLREVLSVYPVSRAAWYAGLAAGFYPPSVSLGKRAVGWTRESIRQLIANPPKF